MTLREYIHYIAAHPYPDPILLGGVIVALAVSTWDRWRERR